MRQSITECKEKLEDVAVDLAEKEDDQRILAGSLDDYTKQMARHTQNLDKKIK